MHNAIDAYLLTKFSDVGLEGFQCE